MRNFPLFVLSCVFCFQLLSQELVPEYKNYKWDADSKATMLEANETKDNAIIEKNLLLVEYIYDSKNQLTSYVTRHKRIKVNSEKAIDEFNKVYISMTDVIELTDLKARVISKDGKITPFDTKNVKFVENYEESGPYKFFALEGVETGSDIEYVYTIQKSASYFGAEYFQGDNKEKNVEFDIYSPLNLVLEAKSYNGFPEFKTDTVLSTKNRIWASTTYISDLKSEKYATYDNNRMRVEYKLAYNKAKGSKRLLTWSAAGDAFYSAFNISDAKLLKKAKPLLKEMKLKTSSSETDKVRCIESFVKTHFVLKTSDEQDFSDLEKILKNRYANAKGMIKLFSALFTNAGIEYQMVFTSNRFKEKFDGSFDTWNYLNNTLFYFPGINDVLAPSEALLRLGYVQPEWTCQKGLFLKPVTIGDYHSVAVTLNDIGCPDYKKNYSTMDIDVKLSEDMSEGNLKIKDSYTGFEVMGLQPLFNYLSDENKKKVSESLLKVISQDAVVRNYKASNYSEEDLFVKPFIIEGEMTLSSLCEKADKFYLFKIGMLIGPQDELYQEEKRQNDMDLPFAHGYTRTITFEIPQGYKAANLEDLKMDVNQVENGERTSEFESSYTVEGNKVKVLIEENYRKVHYPLADFESFRKVINSSADFNKVVIRFEPN